jgi:hypothetical protein
MAAQNGIIVTKSFDYRGVPEEWSNKYWFTQTAPFTSAQFRAVFDNIASHEKTLFSSATTIVGGRGYNDNDEHAHSVWEVDLTLAPDTPIPGTLAPGAAERQAGDSAVFVWWKTSRKNTRGKPIYLRKYFHDVYNEAGPPHDGVADLQKLAMQAFAEGFYTQNFLGFGLAAQGHPDEQLVAYGAHPWITTRTLKRRGKRPKAA